MSKGRFRTLLIGCSLTAIAGTARIVASATAEPVPSPLLTLAEARARALEASPGLKATDARLRATRGSYDQARRYANPELSLEAEDFGGNLPPEVPSQRTLAVSQTVEWFGRRSARIEASRRELDVAALDLQRDRIELLAEVDRRFALLLGAQERRAIAEENARIAADVTAAVAALVRAGEVSPIEESRAQADEALAQVDAATASRDVSLALTSLAELWGETLPTFAGAAGALAEDIPMPEREIATTALSGLPDLARWDAEIGRLQSLRDLADRQALPNLGLSVGKRWYQDGGVQAYVAGLSLAVPLFDRFTGAKAEASARLDEATQERRAEEARLAAGLLAAHETLARARTETLLLRERLLPQARAVFEALGEGYRRGKFPLLDLLEARRSLAAARARYADALLRLNLASIEVRRLTDGAGDNDNGAPQ